VVCKIVLLLKSGQNRYRPIIFVAHSWGGIILKVVGFVLRELQAGSMLTIVGPSMACNCQTGRFGTQALDMWPTIHGNTAARGLRDAAWKALPKCEHCAYRPRYTNKYFHTILAYEVHLTPTASEKVMVSILWTILRDLLMGFRLYWETARSGSMIRGLAEFYTSCLRDAPR